MGFHKGYVTEMRRVYHYQAEKCLNVMRKLLSSGCVMLPDTMAESTLYAFSIVWSSSPYSYSLFLCGCSSDGWEKSWESDITPWDLGKPTPIIEHLVKSGTLPKGRALVPGCGMVSLTKTIYYHLLLSERRCLSLPHMQDHDIFCSTLPDLRNIYYENFLVI